MPIAATGSETAFRLLHSSGEVILANRTAALARLAALPGARLFVHRRMTGGSNADVNHTARRSRAPMAEAPSGC